VEGTDIRMVRTRDPKATRMKAALENPLSIIRELNKRSLYHFIQQFWSSVSTYTFTPNWHIRILCEELEQMAALVGERKPKKHDLIVNVPPGSTKPVWEGMDVLMSDGHYKKLKEKYPDSTNPQVLVMPAFNSLCGGIAANKEGITGPIGKIIEIENAQIFLVDGTYLGKIKDIR